MQYLPIISETYMCLKIKCEQGLHGRMAEITYTLTGFNPGGEGGSFERILGPMTITELRTRVAAIQDPARWLWSIIKYAADRHSEGGRGCVGSVSADEFDGDVPDYD